jgi:hypothetical protein
MSLYIAKAPQRIPFFRDAKIALLAVQNTMFIGTTQPSSATLSQNDIASQIAQYEREFGMSSDEFLQRMREGTAPDTFETMDWMILLRNR